MKKLITTILFSFLFISPTNAAINLEKPNSFVSDLANVLSQDQLLSLENKLNQFEKETSNEIAILIINSLEGEVIENVAVDIFGKWGIGKKDKDNGVLILAAIEDRKIRIEVGYGLEGVLTDAQSFWIIDSIIKPAFRAEKYYEGFDGAVDKIMAATQGEYLPEAQPAPRRRSSKINFDFIIFVVFFGFTWLASVLGRSKSWWAGGVIGLVIALIIGFIKGATIGFIAAIVLSPLGLGFDYIVSKNYDKHKSAGTPIPWWFGGGGRGGGGGFGGFGGFGGGMSGGGGASGDW